MSNITITNNDLGSVIAMNAAFRDELLVFTGIATILEGTILARQDVAVAVVAAAGANTGNGTVTVATVDTVAKVGVYTLTCIEAVTHGGVFKLADPDGQIVAGYLPMTAGSGVATVMQAGGLQFTVTDAGIDFIVGDSFTLTVAADGKVVPYSATGKGGAQIPREILTYEVTSTGAGNVAIRAGVSGSYRKERLVINGSAAGVGITDAIIDQLRDYGLVPLNVTELNILDNQP